MLPVMALPPYNQTLTGYFEFAVAFGGVQTFRKRLCHSVSGTNAWYWCGDLPVFRLRSVFDGRRAELYAIRCRGSCLEDPIIVLTVGYWRLKTQLPYRWLGVGYREILVGCGISTLSALYAAFRGIDDWGASGKSRPSDDVQEEDGSAHWVVFLHLQ